MGRDVLVSEPRRVLALSSQGILSSAAKGYVSKRGHEVHSASGIDEFRRVFKGYDGFVIPQNTVDTDRHSVVLVPNDVVDSVVAHAIENNFFVVVGTNNYRGQYANGLSKCYVMIPLNISVNGSYNTGIDGIDAFAAALESISSFRRAA